MMAPATRIDVSLISHTNVGKTTLARTLLRRDIGEVDDRAHVTDTAESDVLIKSPAGDELVLWDTPGFGDSVRLLRRLQQTEQPFGWFLAQVWDRLADRPFWCGQQAMRTIRESSDVILYIANASEGPGAVTYVDAEMQILGWLGVPVILLLNQLGPPREAADARAELKEWQAHAAQYPCIRSVLPFDAFARCWVQEGTLLGHIEHVLPDQQRVAFGRIREAWKQRSLRVFEHSMQTLSSQLATIAVDIEPIADTGVQGKARSWIGAATSVVTGVPAGAAGDGVELDRAQRVLAARLDQQVRVATEELVRIHGLTGTATQEVLQRMGHEFSVQRPADADKAGVLGGLVSGALGGLAADLGAGGLTFGAGAVIGGVLGAVGARSLAKAYNLVRGSESGTVRWSSEFLSSRLAAALIRYLAVAHFGRGRGDFVAGTVPTHWSEAVREALEKRHGQIEPAWAIARLGTTEHGADVEATAAIRAIATAAAREVLARLYPYSSSMLR